jgi:transposase InsO family protein
MRAHGIEGLRNGKSQRTTLPGPSPIAAPDLVGRDFSAGRPDAVWLADLTYVRTWSGFAYVAFVFDAFSRFIVGWQATNHMRQSLVADAFEMALWQRRGDLDGLIHHSDSEYVVAGSFGWSDPHSDRREKMRR